MTSPAPVTNEVAKRVTIKAYATSVITPGVPVAPATDPAATGGQILRRVSATMNPQIAEFRSNEVTTSQQTTDVRHGGLGVTGTIAGELSPGTYELPTQAVMRCTPLARTTKSQTDFTSLAAANASSKFTIGSSTWAAMGYNVGTTFRSTGLTGPNNGLNFTITGLNGVDAIVYPAPADMTADTSCSLSAPGMIFLNPDPPVKSKWLIEHYNEDTDLGELAIETRFGDMSVSVDDKVVTVQYNYLGRQYLPLDSTAAPFFTSPTNITGSEVTTTYGGVLLINGVAAFVVTKFNFKIDLKATKQDIPFIQFSPEIFLGKSDVTGSFDAMLIDNTYKNIAINETQISLLLTVTTSTSGSADFVTFFFPRLKLGAFTQTGSGDAGITVTYPFSAYQQPAATGFDSTTLLIQDSLAS